MGSACQSRSKCLILSLNISKYVSSNQTNFFGKLEASPLFLTLSPGVVQGMITGIRGLCNGLGPALYGFVFYLFHVELNEMAEVETLGKASKPNMANPTDEVPVQLLTLFAGLCLSSCLNHSRVSLSTEQHHPWATLPVRGVLRAAVAAGGPVHSGTQPGAEVRQPQEAQYGGPGPPPQPTSWGV